MHGVWFNIGYGVLTGKGNAPLVFRMYLGMTMYVCFHKREIAVLLAENPNDLQRMTGSMM